MLDKKGYVVSKNKILAVLMCFCLAHINVEAKPSSFGGSRSYSSPSRSYSSPSKSYSGGSKSYNSPSKSYSGGGKPFSWGSSSSSSSTPKPVQIDRSTVLSSLKKRGATGESAGILYKDFQKKYKEQPSSKKINMDDINKRFEPTYRASRRSEYYSGYRPQVGTHYQESVAQHSNGYGIWDVMLLNSILDNTGDRQMYYNHQQDPSFQQWRTDADKACAAGDTDICTKLKDLDKEMAEYRAKGVKPNPDYITPGVDPDIYEANQIDIKNLPEIKVCTSTMGSDYNRYASEIAKYTKLKVKIVQSNSSVDNLVKLSKGECDLGFVQDDFLKSDTSIADAHLKRIARLQNLEVGFLICPTESKVKTIKDLTDKIMVFIGSDQTGSQYTFDKLAESIEFLKTVKTNKMMPVMEAAQMIKGSADRCLFAVSTPKFQAFKELDDTEKFQGVPIYSWDFRDKKPTYTLVTIDKNYYKHLTQKENMGLFTSNGTDSIGVATSIVAPQAWVDQNKQVYDLLLLERSNLEKSLK